MLNKFYYLKKKKKKKKDHRESSKLTCWVSSWCPWAGCSLAGRSGPPSSSWWWGPSSPSSTSRCRSSVWTPCGYRQCCYSSLSSQFLENVGNSHNLFEIFGNSHNLFENFGNIQKLFENFGNVQKLFETFGNVHKLNDFCFKYTPLWNDFRYTRPFTLSVLFCRCIMHTCPLKLYTILETCEKSVQVLWNILLFILENVPKVFESFKRNTQVCLLFKCSQTCWNL